MKHPVVYDFDRENYKKLREFIAEGTLRVGQESQVKISIDKNEKNRYASILIESSDLIKFDSFLREKNIEGDLQFYLKGNIIVTIMANNIDGLDYLLNDLLFDTSIFKQDVILDMVSLTNSLEMFEYILHHTSFLQIKTSDKFPLEFAFVKTDILEYALNNLKLEYFNIFGSLRYIIHQAAPVENFILLMEKYDKRQKYLKLYFIDSIKYNRPNILEYLMTYDIEINTNDIMKNMKDEDDYTEIIDLLLEKNYLDQTFIKKVS